MCYAIYHMCYAIYDMIYDIILGRYFISDMRHGIVYDTSCNMMYVSDVCVCVCERELQAKTVVCWISTVEVFKQSIDALDGKSMKRMTSQ